MEIYGAYAYGVEVVDLVLHQRDERCDDHRDAGQEHGGYLESDRLAPPGREQAYGVVPRQDGVYDVALERTERVVAPVAAQYILGSALLSGVVAGAV